MEGLSLEVSRTPERFHQIEELYHSAREREGADELTRMEKSKNSQS